MRSQLRRLTGQKLGADPAAWEAWWAANRETFTPSPPGRAGFREESPCIRRCLETKREPGLKTL